ncbi:hypothetical protein F5Y19DRAFT_424365 [Xylariaceae sp. FL1651]|nr:hypothetical protein F5Y19DRAFT_424365 [Xylariaceae sp. FL1651]
MNRICTACLETKPADQFQRINARRASTRPTLRCITCRYPPPPFANISKDNRPQPPPVNLPPIPPVNLPPINLPPINLPPQPQFILPPAPDPQGRILPPPPAQSGPPAPTMQANTAIIPAPIIQPQRVDRLTEFEAWTVGVLQLSGAALVVLGIAVALYVWSIRK